MLRVSLAAVLLVAAWRPHVRGHSRGELVLAAAFGVTLAAMNLSFYESFSRIPLGVAVTCEFVGPLGVAVIGSRRRLDLVWCLLAAGGILLLAAPGGSGLNAAGVALAMVVAGVLTLPAGIAQGGSDLLDPVVLAAGLAVAVLSSVIPYSLELEALRRLPANVFGVLMSLEPAAAAIAGLIVLGQVLGANEWAGMALVIVASAGATRTAPRRAPAPRD